LSIVFIIRSIACGIDIYCLRFAPLINNSNPLSAAENMGHDNFSKPSAAGRGKAPETVCALTGWILHQTSSMPPDHKDIINSFISGAKA
jgi:hypothetical protein